MGGTIGDDESMGMNIKYMFIFSTTCMLLGTAVTSYVIMGAMYFKPIEARAESKSKESLAISKQKLFDESRKAKQKVVVQDLKQFTAQASFHLANYEDALLSVYRKRASGNVKEKLWTMYGSVIFCSSVVTTIGWGNVAPKTLMGRISCIIYAIFGIPMLFSFTAILSAIMNVISVFLSTVLFGIFSFIMAKIKKLITKKPEEAARTNVSKNYASISSLSGIRDNATISQSVSLSWRERHIYEYLHGDDSCTEIFDESIKTHQKRNSCSSFRSTINFSFSSDLSDHQYCGVFDAPKYTMTSEDYAVDDSHYSPTFIDDRISQLPKMTEPELAEYIDESDITSEGCSKFEGRHDGLLIPVGLHKIVNNSTPDQADVIQQGKPFTTSGMLLDPRVKHCKEMRNGYIGEGKSSHFTQDTAARRSLGRGHSVGVSLDRKRHHSRDDDHPSDKGIHTYHGHLSARTPNTTLGNGLPEPLTSCVFDHVTSKCIPNQKTQYPLFDGLSSHEIKGVIPDFQPRNSFDHVPSRRRPRCTFNSVPFRQKPNHTFEDVSLTHKPNHTDDEVLLNPSSKQIMDNASLHYVPNNASGDISVDLRSNYTFDDKPTMYRPQNIFPSADLDLQSHHSLADGKQKQNIHHESSNSESLNRCDDARDDQLHLKTDNPNCAKGRGKTKTKNYGGRRRSEKIKNSHQVLAKLSQESQCININENAKQGMDDTKAEVSIDDIIDNDGGDVEVPFVAYCVTVMAYIMVGGIFFQDLDTGGGFTDGLYFTFVMLTTIGFGDIVPTPEYYITLLVYGALGLALANFVTNMMIDKIVDILELVTQYWENKLEGNPRGRH